MHSCGSSPAIECIRSNNCCNDNMTDEFAYLRVPVTLISLLARDRNLHAGVLASLVSFEEWVSGGKLFFFPEYTDHGPKHISALLETAPHPISSHSLTAFPPSHASQFTIPTLFHFS